MGGSGSGNRWQSGKRTTCHMRVLDIRRLYRKKLLVPGRFFNWMWSRDGERIADINIAVAEYHVTLSYRTRKDGGEWEDRDYPVSLTWTACRFGGQRPWFLCPRCGRRVAVLYGGATFACRHCHNLAYASQREDEMSRAMRRAQKIQNRLGWYDRHDGTKPKGMHWRTFERLAEAYKYYDMRSWLAMAQRFNLFPP